MNTVMFNDTGARITMTRFIKITRIQHIQLLQKLSYVFSSTHAFRVLRQVGINTCIITLFNRSTIQGKRSKVYKMHEEE